MQSFRNALAPLAFLMALTALPATAQDADNGTDPTKVRRMFWTSFEHMDMGPIGSRHTAKAIYEMPLAERTGLRLTLPLQRYQMPGLDNDFDFGDIALRLHHIPVVTKTYGVVVQGELIFDTVGRHELGYGTTVLKGTAIYARFLSNGSILAPSLSHSEALGGHTDVSETVLDLYFVPRLADPSIFVTVDPAIISNWETDAVYGSLAVTVGKTVGKMWNGTAQVYVKPTLLVGNDRPADWAVEVGFKVLGF